MAEIESVAEVKTKKAKKKKKKIKKGWIVLAVIVAIIAAFIIYVSMMVKQSGIGSSVYTGDIYEVGVKDLKDTISATGLVESSEDGTAKVYSTLAYKIESVNVELGDKVNAGDVLCVYETETLDRQIHEKELSMSSTQRSSALSLATAKLNYDTYLAGVNDGTNASLVSAQSSYDTASETYQRAQKDYDEYVAKVDSDAVIALNQALRTLDNAQNDYDDLKSKIANKTHSQIKSAQRAVDNAREAYEEYRDKVNDDETTSLYTADNAQEAAYKAYVAARTAYNNAQDALDDLNDELTAARADEIPDADLISSLETQVAAQQTTVDSLKATYETKKSAYEQADRAYSLACQEADTALDNYKNQYDNARDSYDSVIETLNETLDKYDTALKNAVDAYTTAKETADNTLESYQTALTNAKRSFENADNALKNAKISTDNQLESYRVAYQNAQNSASTALADFQLANMYEDLNKATVTAPISGTVTAVYANEDETASGVMFVIENTETLIVSSTVKAYDLDKVSEGMSVEIKTDVTGDTVFNGVLESVAPTAKKDAAGNVISTNDAEFETVIRVEDENTGLRIGVSARIEYIVDKTDNATVVPESAIVYTTEGSYVLVITGETEKGFTLARADVQYGVSDGIYTAVTGVDEGAKIVDNATNYAALVGMPLTYSEVDYNALLNNMYGMNMGM